jgi:hypothetical protein
MKTTNVLEKRFAWLAGSRVILQPIGDHLLLRRLGCSSYSRGEAAHG